MSDWQSAGKSHSPTPWEISPCRTVDDTAMIVGGEAFQFGLIADVTEDQDAAFIINAVNNIDALVKALEDMVAGFGPIIEGCDCHSCAKVSRAREALAKAATS